MDEYINERGCVNETSVLNKGIERKGGVSIDTW